MVWYLFVWGFVLFCLSCVVFLLLFIADYCFVAFILHWYFVIVIGFNNRFL